MPPGPLRAVDYCTEYELSSRLIEPAGTWHWASLGWAATVQDEVPFTLFS